MRILPVALLLALCTQGCSRLATLESLDEKQVILTFSDTSAFGGAPTVTAILLFYKDDSKHNGPQCDELSSKTTATLNGKALGIGGLGGRTITDCANGALWESRLDALETGPITLVISDETQTVTLRSGPLIGRTYSTTTDLAGHGVHPGETIVFSPDRTDGETDGTPPSGCTAEVDAGCTEFSGPTVLDARYQGLDVALTLSGMTPTGHRQLHVQGAYRAPILECTNAASCTASEDVSKLTTPVNIVP